MATRHGSSPSPDGVPALRPRGLEPAVQIAMWPTALEGLAPEQLRRVEAAQKRRSLAPRTLLYRENAPVGAISVVERGRVRSYFNLRNGKEFTNRVSGRGTVLGLASILVRRPAFISIECIDEVTVAQITRDDLAELLDEIPRLSQNLNRALAALYIENVSKSRRALEPAAVRLGKVLLGLATADEPTALSRPAEIRGMSQQDIAGIVGASRTWITLTLGGFEAHGLIERHRARIRIPDPGALAEHIATLEARWE